MEYGNYEGFSLTEHDGQPLFTLEPDAIVRNTETLDTAPKLARAFDGLTDEQKQVYWLQLHGVTVDQVDSTLQPGMGREAFSRKVVLPAYEQVGINRSRPVKPGQPANQNAAMLSLAIATGRLMVPGQQRASEAAAERVDDPAPLVAAGLLLTGKRVTKLAEEFGDILGARDRGQYDRLLESLRGELNQPTSLDVAIHQMVAGGIVIARFDDVDPPSEPWDFPDLLEQT